MNEASHLPPPPSNPMYRPEEGDIRPTYWLYTEAKGMEGPYTKKEARGIVAGEPDTAFLACREGEEWQDAAARLAPKKKSFPWRYPVMLILVAAVAFGAWKWHLKQEEERLARRNEAAAEAAAAAADSAKSKTGP